MKKIVIGILLMATHISIAQTWKTEDQYIQNFAHLAVLQMEKYKIPASITLAQGLLETGGGQSRLAKEGNNHFGIKCKENWTGKSMKHTDDAPNECFRVYDSPEESYEDHSLFLTTRKHYSNLFALDATDYKAWAHGLKKSGYATNPRYAYGLISKIEKHNLHEFDGLSSKEVHQLLLKRYPSLAEDPIFMAKAKTLRIPPAKPIKAPIIRNTNKDSFPKMGSTSHNNSSILVRNHPNGGLKYIIVPYEMDLKSIAERYNIPLNRLQRWNELNRTKLNKNEIIFLESKNSEGSVDNYTANIGDTMHSIAQKFAIRIDKLYSKNEMHPGTEPKAGETIYLKGKKPRS